MVETTTTKSINEGSTAPEGGWGWYVVLGYAMNNMVVIPLLQVFGLLYKDILVIQLKLTNVQISVIITANISCGMLLAIFNGPILRNFGYRKVAILGALLVFCGNFLTSQATSFTEFLIYFSILVSIGTNFVMAAFNLALNTYFVVKRGVATGIAMSITGFGPILMPVLTSFLMSLYDIRGTGKILAALTLHSLVAALLLQPVKWHKKKPKTNDVELEKAKDSKVLDDSKNNGSFSKEPELGSRAVEIPDKNEHEITPATKLMENESDRNDEKSKKLTFSDEENPPLRSLNDIVKPHRETCGERIVRFFDLDLLHDCIYLNISSGLALAFVSEMSFTIMLPILVQDRGFGKDDTAWMLSSLATADIMSRFTSPLIGDSLKSKVRITYLFSLICGILFREIFNFCHSFWTVLLVIIMLGVTKGIRSVYTALVIPSYVPLHKLASASGLQMVFNGILLGICGPLLGKIRDDTGNYTAWIHTINCFTLLTILLWSTEMLLIRRKQQQKRPIVKPAER